MERSNVLNAKEFSFLGGTSCYSSFVCLFVCFETVSHSVVQGGFKLMIFYVFMYVNGKMCTAETILGMGRGE
jgi:hypothetical protein